MNTFFCLLLCFQALPQPALSPALLPSSETLEKMWRVGYQRAETDKTLYRAYRPATKPIGKSGTLNVSWVTFLHPRLTAFEKGFVARKENRTATEQAASRASLLSLIEDSRKSLHFHGEIGIYPVSSGRKANAENLRDIQVEMHIGSRTYLPKKQPGDLGVHKYEATYSYNTSIDPNFPNYVYAKYTYYEGDFDVAFDLYDSHGMPTVTESDNEITIVVTGKFGRQQATFRLQDWLEYYEK